MSTTRNKFSSEVCARAVRMVVAHQGETEADFYLSSFVPGNLAQPAKLQAD